MGPRAGLDVVPAGIQTPDPAARSLVQTDSCVLATMHVGLHVKRSRRLSDLNQKQNLSTNLVKVSIPIKSAR
jgi:hypothetical protein